MTGWAVEALIASALLMAVVLLVRVPVRRLFGPQVAYALWALPALRMVTPPLPADWREQAAMPISRAGEAMTVLILPTAAPMQAAATVAAVEPAAALPWGAMLAAAWLLGAGAFFLLHLLRHRQFCRRLLKDARTLDEIDGVRVIETAAAAGPLAFGMARRFVAFPDDFADRYDADERELALAHELGHHARGDLIANWAALALLAVHWFNPLAWRAFRAFRCDQELANDARVLAGRSRTDRHIYACAIVKAAHGGAISAACHLHTIADLKGRLKMLTNIRPSRARLATGAAAVLGVVVTGLAATASGTQAAAAITERVEQATGVAIAAPATVPPAPAAPVATPAPVREGRAVKRVVVVGDGRSTTYEGKDADRVLADHRIAVATMPTPPAPAGRSMPAMPPRVTVTRVDSETIVDNGHGSMAIRSGDCRPVDGNETVLHREEQGRRVTIICNNRISVQADTAMRVAMASRQAAFAERQAAMAGREADRAQRQAAIAERRANEAKASGLKQAIAGIQMARASIENDRNLSGEQRTQALAGLDDAMREVRRDLAD